jgi:glycosyltransferase involved in cell wall biosynthesis
MRIGIDARFYGVKSKGLGRYTQKLIENLESIQDSSTADEYFVFLRKDNFKEYKPKNKKFHKVLADYQWYSFSEQISMPKILNKYQLDLVHFPHFNVPIFYKKPFIITIHDLILLHFPTVRSSTLSPVFYWMKFLAYKLVIGLAIKKSKKIITVSEFTKNDIINNYEKAKNKTVVTYEACDDLVRGTEEDLNDDQLKKYDIIKPYILYVGNAYPHKNLENLIRAFSKVSNSDLSLVLVGKIDYFYKKIKKIVEENKIQNVIFTDFVSDKDLSRIYKGAKLYMFPSLYEGFGLPPLEAMQRGVPVASSDHGCMKEILGDAAIYFDARKRDEIKGAIEEMISDEQLRINLIKKGNSQIKKYSWKKMAKETLEEYKK